MSQEILEHLPKWRRIIHELAVEAGIKKFVKTLNEEDKESLVDSTSSKPNPREAER